MELGKGNWTAISRRQLSLPMRWLRNQELLRGKCLDFGCGRGGDATIMGFAYKYDPIHFPDWPSCGDFDTITCIYVLNTVTPDEQQEILKSMLELLRPGGRCFIAVRRDLPREGKRGRGCYQRYVELDLPILYEDSGFCLYQMRKECVEV